MKCLTSVHSANHSFDPFRINNLNRQFFTTESQNIKKIIVQRVLYFSNAYIEGINEYTNMYIMDVFGMSSFNDINIFLLWILEVVIFLVK